MANPSLWPDKHNSSSPPRPIQLLEEQAKLLSEYNPSLEGRVVSAYAEGKTTATISLYIINPSLRGYNYRLLSFEQPILGEYPVTLVAHFKSGSATAGEANDDKEFLSVLGKILSDTMTRNILDNLASMSKVMQHYSE